MARKSRREPIINYQLSIINCYKTAIYARASSGDCETLENQIELVRQYIDRQADLQLVAVFQDNGQTGTNFEREGFENMMDAAKKGDIGCVVVKDLSRFGRCYIETGNYLDKIFPFMGLRFISVNDGYDNHDPAGGYDSLLISLKSLMSSTYAKDISRKTGASVEMRQQKGEFIGLHAAYGYLKCPEHRGKLVVDPVAAPVVQDIFRWKLEGMSSAGIARKLNALGISAPNKYRFEKGILKSGRNAGVIWQRQTIIKMLQNPVYMGYVSQGKSKQRLYQGLKHRRTGPDEWVNVPDMHEAIIDRETFEAVGKLL